MKKLLIIGLLFSSFAFANREADSLGACKGKQFMYLSMEHLYKDVCITEYSAISPGDCKLKIKAAISKTGKIRNDGRIQKFLTKRSKEFCGN